VDSRRCRVAFTAGGCLQARQNTLTSDAAFLRRIYLDIIGLPPAAEEVSAFLADSSSDKRTKLIDRCWPMNAVRGSCDERVAGCARGEPHADQCLAQQHRAVSLVSARLPARSQTARPHGHGAAHDAWRCLSRRQRRFCAGGENDAPFATKGHIIASAFLGVELQCARCHDSPYHSTTQRDLYSLAAMLERKTVTVPKTSRVPAAFFEKKARESLIRVTLKPDEPVTPVWPFAEVTGAAENAGLDARCSKIRRTLVSASRP
jgi:hypothetical protein